MRINFISSNDLKEIRTMHAKSDNIKIMMDSETNDIVKKLFKSLQKYQKKIRRINERKAVRFW